MDAKSSPRIPDGQGLGEAIRQHRLRNRITQQQLAHRLGVTQQSVARWERGMPPRPGLIPLIQAELSGEPSEELAALLAFPVAQSEQHPTDGRSEKYTDFMDGCVDIVRRGVPLSEALMLAVARYVGALDR